MVIWPGFPGRGRVRVAARATARACSTATATASQPDRPRAWHPCVRTMAPAFSRDTDGPEDRLDFRDGHGELPTGVGPAAHLLVKLSSYVDTTWVHRISLVCFMNSGDSRAAPGIKAGRSAVEPKPPQSHEGPGRLKHDRQKARPTITGKDTVATGDWLGRAPQHRNWRESWRAETVRERNPCKSRPWL